MQAWTPVKVKNEQHPRAGQAGTTKGEPEPGKSLVTFDLDNATELVDDADLQALA